MIISKIGELTLFLQTLLSKWVSKIYDHIILLYEDYLIQFRQ